MDKNELKLLESKKHANSKDGFCLSTEYKGYKDKLEWKCSNKNHKSWKALFYPVVKSGKWCPECAKERRYFSDFDHSACQTKNPNGLLNAQNFAKSKGGSCLSTVYVNSRTKLVFKCHDVNHEPWESTYNNSVTGGYWCPKCGKTNLCEDKIRKVFEIVFDAKFPSVKEKWNINHSTNKRLELDGYNSELKLAFEHNGHHHYMDSNNFHFFNKEKSDISIQIERDGIKKNNCENNNVLLVEIPWNKYFFNSEKYVNYKRMILEHLYVCCLDAGMKIPKISFGKIRKIYGCI
ncbi:hypothetical protein [Burkholderia cepacia]|uniref:hypothetical protein n=1 Tax=Burkholderia cepacia TaxID=292 RepID=UPI001588F58A|nr:hypothetical protein [Burkholderia cepacia]